MHREGGRAQGASAAGLPGKLTWLDASVSDRWQMVAELDRESEPGCEDPSTSHRGTWWVMGSHGTNLSEGAPCSHLLLRVALRVGSRLVDVRPGRERL